ncbi:hypothetical protein DY000_02003034, partial [Brassica cretica]
MGQLKYSVFLCFRGEDVRVGFLSYLIGTLKRKSIKYYVDYEETRGEVMEIFLQRIAESRIVLVILSPKFMESDWCIDEVLKALETREAGTSIIPVFYKVSVADVKGWNIVKQGDRDKFINVTKRLGLRSKDYPTSEADFVNKIVEELEKALTKLETEEEENKLKMKQAITTNTTMPFFGTNKRVKQLQEKLMMGIPTHTRLVGVVGMKGSGKTNLAEMFFEEGKCYFLRHLFFRDKIGKNMESGAKRDLLDFAGAVRGIFLDMSEVSVARALGQKPFHGMKELRYLKLYTSCTRFPESDSKLNFPEGLKFSLEKVRYLHWHKFPFPEDFTPKNLVDLKLPYSNIIRLWDSSNDVTNLRWVDLSHSINLQDLSGLSGAGNLERLNLEGCTGLTELPKEIMETMTSLLYLNMRRCTSLISLREITIKSLKTLILTNCSNLEKFQMILENIEALHLDGTALKELPESIKDRKKLVKLSLKDCTKLASVPDSVGKLQALGELILSGCSNLRSFPDVKGNMKRLRILLLDGTAINQVPQAFPSGSNGLQRLSLRGNLVIQTIQAHIGQLFHLKFLDLQDCKNLTSIPVLPPNLQCLDAHGCDSLTTVANPLAFLNLTDQIRTTLRFSQCNNLDEVSKSYIISYIQKKSQLMSSAFKRYSLSYVMESYTGACFPGCHVPEWFRYQEHGPVIETELRRHESENRLIGLDLCAVVSFQHCQDQISGFHVKCTYEFKNADGSLIRRLRCTVGGFSGTWTEPRKVESDHVFVSYTSLLEDQETEEDKKVCSSTKVSVKFEVIDDDAGELVTRSVLKCGFSMVYEPEGTDHDKVSWELGCDGPPNVADQNTDDDDEPMSFTTQEAEVIPIDGQGSNGDDE